MFLIILGLMFFAFNNHLLIQITSYFIHEEGHINPD